MLWHHISSVHPDKDQDEYVDRNDLQGYPWLENKFDKYGDEEIHLELRENLLLYTDRIET